jgi:hypothetical protein
MPSGRDSFRRNRVAPTDSFILSPKPRDGGFQFSVANVSSRQKPPSFAVAFQNGKNSPTPRQFL